MLDARCFIDHLNTLTSMASANNSQLLQNKNKLNDLHHALTIQTPRTMDLLIKKVSYIESAVRRLEDAFVGQLHRPTKPPARVRAARFSVSSKGLQAYKTLSALTTAFFVEDFATGYARDKTTADWQNKEFREPLTRLFSKVKRAVRLVLLFSDSYPKPNFPKDAIRSVSEAAEKELRPALGACESDTLSPSTIEKKPFAEQVKALETSRQLPPDTPEDMKKWWWKKKSS